MARTVTGEQSGVFGSYTSQVYGTVAPAVPLSLTPVTNPSTTAFQVVITGGTMTNVSVNGVTVGAGAGTYTVPGFGSIVMTYTVAPTWAWSVPVSFLAAKNSDGSPVSVTGVS